MRRIEFLIVEILLRQKREMYKKTVALKYKLKGVAPDNQTKHYNYCPFMNDEGLWFEK